jgi:hypothetical protein
MTRLKELRSVLDQKLTDKGISDVTTVKYLYGEEFGEDDLKELFEVIADFSFCKTPFRDRIFAINDLSDEDTRINLKNTFFDSMTNGLKGTGKTGLKGTGSTFCSKTLMRFVLNAKVVDETSEAELTFKEQLIQQPMAIAKILRNEQTSHIRNLEKLGCLPEIPAAIYDLAVLFYFFPDVKVKWDLFVNSIKNDSREQMEDLWWILTYILVPCQCIASIMKHYGFISILPKMRPNDPTKTFKEQVNAHFQNPGPREKMHARKFYNLSFALAVSHYLEFLAKYNDEAKNHNQAKDGPINKLSMQYLDAVFVDPVSSNGTPKKPKGRGK